MHPFDNLLLAVRSPQDSAKLYEKLFDGPPVESSPNFVLFVLPNGFKFGLWAAHDVQPKPNRPGGTELCFIQPSREAVLQRFEEWRALGLEVLQQPVDMDFGFTFTVADADGHRLRAYVLAESPR